jgi:NRAMP (natural resistance-associated macrophage protein)-like metal ion transporter
LSVRSLPKPQSFKNLAVSGRSSFKKKSFWSMFGPGLVTGASDDDPSGIATYSQVGAQFGYGLLWAMWFSYPFMAVIQEISARVGRVTGVGLAGNLKAHYPRSLLHTILGLMLMANVLNLGADIGAMAAATQLVLPGGAWIYICLFGLSSLALQMYVPYTRYVKYLKWLTLSLLAYIATVFFVHLSWRQALHATLVPPVVWTREYFVSLIAVLGTTISPYLFFWQASQEVEEVECHDDQKPLKKSPREAPAQLERIRWDTYVGMALSNLVAFFIILTAAATLHARGITVVANAAQAAQALSPLGGRWAVGFFVAGITGTGMLAIPVLAGSAAFAMGESFHWRASLEDQPAQAPRFYLAIVAATVVGVLLNFLHLDPIRALFWSAVVNGVLAAPVMAVIVHMATSKKVMGKFVIPLHLRIVGWAGTLVMFIACLGVFATLK